MYKINKDFFVIESISGSCCCCVYVIDEVVWSFEVKGRNDLLDLSMKDLLCKDTDTYTLKIKRTSVRIESTF